MPGNFGVLNTHLYIEVALHGFGQAARNVCVYMANANIFKSSHLGLHLFPPLFGRPGAIGVHNYLFGSATGFL